MNYKIFFLLLIIMIFAVSGHYLKKNEERIETFEIMKINDNYTDIYNNFYANIYDELFNSTLKTEYEIQNIKIYSLDKYKKKNGKNKIYILDAGCGTGKHIKTLDKHGYKCTGLDKSNFMLDKARKLNPGIIFKKGDFHIRSTFKRRTFSHIMCLFFTIYYSNNIEKVFKNFNYWLKPKGYLILHLIHRNKFDPVLEKASSLIPLFNPQKNTDKRVTKTKLHFKTFKYISDWNFKSNNVEFIENFILKNNSNIVKNVHKFNILKVNEYIKLLKKYGFKLTKIIDLTLANYEYNNLYIFEKIYG